MPSIQNLETKQPFKRRITQIDPDTYEWAKREQSEGLKQNFVYATILISVAAIYVTYGYLLIQKIKA
jgi:hypothetical protein